MRLALLLLLPLGCDQPSAELTHDAYVWQRAWTPEVTDAVRARGPALDGLRVLVATIEGERVAWSERLRSMPADTTAVIRVEGAGALDDALLGDVVERALASHPSVVGVEVDFDCATSKLAGYARALTMLRPRVGERRLSATALPTWSGSPDLPALVDAVDEIVLQVHSVERPDRELFTNARARAFVDRFSRVRPSAPFRVALPAYGTRVGGVELRADPVEVSAFLRGLETRRGRPANLVGVVWFRLPVDGDAGAWSWPTLDAVRRGRALDAKVAVALEGVDVIATNTGAFDARAPARVGVRAHSVAGADGVREYAWRDGALVADGGAPWLAPGERRVIGWVRGEEVAVDAP